MSERRSRHYRRVSQACENCRYSPFACAAQLTGVPLLIRVPSWDSRKKIRCLGQKPNCSSCVRLNQECCYKEEEDTAVHKVERRMSNRLSRVEERLDQIFGSINGSQPGPSTASAQEATPASTTGIQDAGSSYSPVAWSAQTAQKTTPKEYITMALEVYFEHIHRQPLWLLDPDSAALVETSEQLTCILLALGTACFSQKFTGSDLRPPSFYASRASSIAMLEVARQEVTLQTLQCLGLLALYNVSGGDLRGAGLNISIGRNVFHYLAQRSNSSTAAASSDQSKVFWSLTYLESFYGNPSMGSFIPGHISNPRQEFLEPVPGSFGGIPLPENFRPAAVQSQYQDLDDIWSQTMRLCSLWQETRKYVSKCIEGLGDPPWKPTSTYTALCSRIVDLEDVWPRRLSYNTARFQDRSPEEIQNHKSIWIPWLKAQETALTTLLDSFHDSNRGTSAITGPMSLMWTLLDISAPQFPNYPSAGSNQKTTGVENVDRRVGLNIEHPDVHADAEIVDSRNFRESTARYDSPPEWAASRIEDAESATANTGPSDSRYQERMEGGWTEPVMNDPTAFSQQDIILVDPTWGPLEYMMRVGDPSSGAMDLWDFGNL
ncbi:hypothetical protein LIA77_06773 [Sarocladium implicatum]|nr:hypothetical protein LIA77_06773 [Sarocladium implicatum]